MPGFDENAYEASYLPAIRALFNRERIIADAFLRYGLEPEEDDTAAIKAHTAGAHLYWGRKFNHPTEGLLFKTLHADNETRRKVEDPKARALLRLSVKDERATRARKEQERLENWIKIAAAPGYLSPERHASLVAQLKADGFDEALIRKGLEQIPLRDGGSTETLEEGLPEMIRKQIQTYLTILGQADLYSFLMIPPNADGRLWNERYLAVHDKSRKGGSGPQAEAAKKLLGIVKQSVLPDPRKYAKARDFALAKSLEPKVQMWGADGVISAQGYESLLADGLELGFSEKTCATAICWLASKHRIAIAAKSDGSDGSSTLCPACHKLIRSAAGQQNCPHCRQSLWTTCPECNGRVPAALSQCGLCGFPLARKSYVDGVLEMGTNRLHAADLPEAEKCLNELEKVWIGGRVAKLRREFERAIDGVENLAAEFRQALGAHAPYRAGGLLTRLRAAGPAYVFRDGATFSVLEGMVQSVIAEAEKIVQAGRNALLSRETNKAVGFFEDALRVARDSAEAREGLSRCVPEPPTALRCVLGAKSVNLAWNPSPAIGEIEYVVVGRQDGAPHGVRDGEELAAIRDTNWDDETLKPGARRFYSIFARRGQACSSALSSAEVVGEFEARGVRVSALESSVAGVWEALPAGVLAVVTRSAPPGSTGPPQVIQCGSSGFTDSAVVVGGDYEYRIAVEYSMGGRTRRTVGMVHRVQLEPAPEPIAELKTRNRNRSEIEITWPPPPRGEVELYALPTPPSEKPGARLERKSLEGWRPHLITATGSSAVWTRPAGGSRFITAVTVLNDRAVMGPNVLDIPDIGGLEGRNEGSAIILIWVWPEGCDSVRVVWKHDRFPNTPEDRAAGKQEVSRGIYSLEGGFRLPSPAAKDYYFTVFPGVAMGRGVQYGGGSSEESRIRVRGGARVKIHYGIKKPFFGKQLELRVESGNEGDALPELRLIANTSGLQPTSVDDGQEVLHIENRTSPFETLFEMRRKGFLRLFLADRALSDRYQIIDPNPKDLNRTK